MAKFCFLDQPIRDGYAKFRIFWLSRYKHLSVIFSFLNSQVPTTSSVHILSHGSPSLASCTEF